VMSREAAHSFARVVRVKGDQAGAGILAALINAVRASTHIEVREGWRAERLIGDARGGCAGVLARDETGALHPIEASDTVLIPDTADAPIIHKVLGKSWNWGEDTRDTHYIPKKQEKAFEAKLKDAERIPHKDAPAENKNRPRRG